MHPNVFTLNKLHIKICYNIGLALVEVYLLPSIKKYNYVLRNIMTFLIINDGNKYQIATITESHKNNILVDIFPDNQKRKLKLDQQIYQLPTINSSNVSQFKQQVDNLINQIDLELLSELIEDCNIKYKVEDLAGLYFGDNYNIMELTAMVFALANCIIMFYDHKNGAFNKQLPEEQDRQRFILEQKQQKQQIFNNYYTALIEGKDPYFDQSIDIIKLLYKPDKNSTAYKALLEASRKLAISQLELCNRIGLVDDLAEFHIKCFMLDNFPHGINYDVTATGSNYNTHDNTTPDLTTTDVHTQNTQEAMDTSSITSYIENVETNLDLQVFSIDDSTTTEIDDAFSIQRTATGSIVGIHIAAPAFDQTLENMVCENISTIYFPGHKITMLPQDIINKYSLNENKHTPVVSIYFVLDHDLNTLEYYSKVEIVKIAHNLRIEELELIFNHDNLATKHNYPYESELKLLYKFANKLEETRGKPSVNNLSLDYSFSFDDAGKIIIKPRVRGNPIDKLVSELMILANCTWGRMLTNAFIPAIYRVKQPNYPVKMTLTADSHMGLNVSYYTWATSPLRRSADYINQHQIIKLVTHQKDYYTAINPILLEVVENFDKQYAKYIDFQTKMERYWSLKYLIQENITEISAIFIYKSKVQLDGIPLELDTQGFTTAKPKGSQIMLKLFNINLVNLTFDFKILETNTSIMSPTK
jgi:exoribonuclease-2